MSGSGNMTCRGFLQCILRVLNYLLTLVGSIMVLYSLWMLYQWQKHSHVPSPAPSPFVPDDFLGHSAQSSVSLSLPLPSEKPEDHNIETLLFVMEQPMSMTYYIFNQTLPAPWFIYAFLGAGVLTCLITCTGHIATELANACCLSCYTLLLVVLLLLQGAVTAAIFFDHSWRADIPADPTGELEKICDFIESNYDICKWTGLAVLIVEALSVLFSLTLRAVLDDRKSGYDSDDDYLPRSQRQALLRQAPNNAAVSATTAERPARTDEWSKRMREKYGLDTNEFTYNPGTESRRFDQQGAAGNPSVSTGEKKGGCTIM